jgi:hypothetical protein
MEKEFVPYEIALALKELGFNEPCISFYTQNAYGSTKDQIVQYWIEPVTGNDDYVFVLAPLRQQAFRWFREKHGLWNMIYPRDGWNYVIQGIDETISCTGESFHNVEIKSYEEAELECLKKLIEIVKSQ